MVTPPPRRRQLVGSGLGQLILSASIPMARSDEVMVTRPQKPSARSGHYHPGAHSTENRQAPFLPGSVSCSGFTEIYVSPLHHIFPEETITTRTTPRTTKDEGSQASADALVYTVETRRDSTDEATRRRSRRASGTAIPKKVIPNPKAAHVSRSSTCVGAEGASKQPQQLSSSHPLARVWRGPSRHGSAQFCSSIKKGTLIPICIVKR